MHCLRRPCITGPIAMAPRGLQMITNGETASAAGHGWFMACHDMTGSTLHGALLAQASTAAVLKAVLHQWPAR
jgi:hypothetical protein